MKRCTVLTKITDSFLDFRLVLHKKRENFQKSLTEKINTLQTMASDLDEILERGDARLNEIVKELPEEVPVNLLVSTLSF